jgi:hypothetical protein
MSLSDWERNGWLSRHTTSAQEIGNLLAIVERDLRDSRSDDVSPDWRLNIAYNAVLQAANAALAAAGYRAAKGSNSHHHTIQSLALTVGLDASLIRKIEVFRKRRNMTEYDQAGVTSPDEAGEMRAVAIAVHDKVIAWIQTNSPDLMK